MEIKKIDVESVDIHMGKPDPNCSKCHGSGKYHGLWCTCTIKNATFSPPVKKPMLIAVEKTPEGGVVFDLQEIKEPLKPHTEVKISSLPDCDICKQQGITRSAQYDGKTKQGPWAYVCESCFHQYGVGLGLGKGQKLEMKT